MLLDDFGVRDGYEVLITEQPKGNRYIPLDAVKVGSHTLAEHGPGEGGRAGHG